MHEELIDHILLHCAKTRTLWVLFFGVQWVLPASVKTTLLGWNGSFVEKREGKFGELTHYVFFGRFGRQGTELHLKMMCCPSKVLRVLLFIFFGQR